MMKAKRVDMDCNKMTLGNGTVTEADDSMRLIADESIAIEPGAVIKFHNHTLTSNCLYFAKSIISTDDHTLQVVDMAGVAYDFDMNSDHILS